MVGTRNRVNGAISNSKEKDHNIIVSTPMISKVQSTILSYLGQQEGARDKNSVEVAMASDTNRGVRPVDNDGCIQMEPLAEMDLHTNAEAVLLVSEHESDTSVVAHRNEVSRGCPRLLDFSVDLSVIEGGDLSPKPEVIGGEASEKLLSIDHEMCQNHLAVIDIMACALDKMTDVICEQKRALDNLMAKVADAHVATNKNFALNRAAISANAKMMEVLEKKIDCIQNLQLKDQSIYAKHCKESLKLLKNITVIESKLDSLLNDAAYKGPTVPMFYKEQQTSEGGVAPKLNPDARPYISTHKTGALGAVTEVLPNCQPKVVCDEGVAFCPISIYFAPIFEADDGFCNRSFNISAFLLYCDALPALRTLEKRDIVKLSFFNEVGGGAVTKIVFNSVATRDLVWKCADSFRCMGIDVFPCKIILKKCNQSRVVSDPCTTCSQSKNEYTKKRHLSNTGGLTSVMKKKCDPPNSHQIQIEATHQTAFSQDDLELINVSEEADCSGKLCSSNASS